MTNGALAVTQQANISAVSANPRYTLPEIIQIARYFAASGLFKDVKNEAQAIAKILAGQEIGIGPMQAISSIHIVDGRPCLDATLVGAKIRQSGRYDYRVITTNEQECVLHFFDRNDFVGASSFTMAEAARAGLANKTTWKSYPQDMLRSRALTRGARTYAPEVFGGAVYTPEEIGAEVSIDENGSTRVHVSPGAVQTASTTRALQQPVNDPVRGEQWKNALAAAFSACDAIAQDPADQRRVRDTITKTLKMAKPFVRWADLSLEDLQDFVFALEGSPLTEPIVTHADVVES